MSRYHDLARIDTGSSWISQGTWVPPFLPSSLNHGAIDKHALSGIGSSHDTTLMLLQNNENHSGDQEVAAFSTKAVFEQMVNCWSLEDIMTCQQLKFANRHSDQAFQFDIHGHFSVIRRILIEYKNIPSFTATNTILLWRKSSHNACHFYTNYSTSCHILQHHQYSYGESSEFLKSKGTWS